MTTRQANDAAFVEAHNAIMRKLSNLEDPQGKDLFKAIECCYAVGLRALQRTTGEALPEYVTDAMAVPKKETTACVVCGATGLVDDMKSVRGGRLCGMCRS